jgi:NitT/TauT family transport system permease protein
LVLVIVATATVLGHLREQGGFRLRSFERPDTSRLSSAAVSVAGALAFVGIWSFLSSLRYSGPTRIPSPASTLLSAWELATDGRLFMAIAISGWRIVVGFGAAAVIGTTLGWLAGSFSVINRLVLPTNSFLRYIPPTAFVTLLIVYFGVGQSYKFSVVFLSVFFFIVQMTVDTVEDIDKRYLEMGLLSGMNQLTVFRKIVVPASFPRVVDVLRINLSGAWTFLVAAEVIGAQGGLGHLIAISQRFGRIEELYVSILIFGVIGLVTDFLIQRLSRRMFVWNR